MGNGITDFIEEHHRTAMTSTTVVASITLTKLVGKTAGATVSTIVQPAIWVISGNKPDAVDAGLWATGAALAWAGEAIGGIAVGATKIIKAVVDDETQKLLSQARASEPAQYRNGIRACCNYESFAAGQGIEAGKIASLGGTAWLHPNGLWVYLQDANKHLVCDYNPNIAQTVYQPTLPLRPAGGGRFQWRIARG